MTFNLNLTADHINAIFAGLNKLEHGQVRTTFDHILQQVQKQEAAAQAPQVAPQAAPQAAEDAPVAGLSD